MRLTAHAVADYCQASLVRITEKRARMCGALWLEAIIIVKGRAYSTTTSEHWEDQRWGVHQAKLVDKLNHLALEIGDRKP